MSAGEGDRRARLFRPESWRYYLGFYRGSFRRLALYGAASAAQALLVLPVLLLIRHAFDHAMPEGRIGTLALIGAGVLAARLLHGAVALWLRAGHLRIIKDATLLLREDLLGRLFSFSRSHLASLDRNTTHAQLVQDTERLDTMSSEFVSKMVPALFTSLPLLAVLAWLNWWLLLVMLGLGPLFLLSIRLVGGAVRRGVFACHRAFEAMSKGILFVLHHLDLTRLLSFDAEEEERQRGRLRAVRETSERMALLFAAHAQLQRAVAGVAGVVILVAGGAAVARGSMSLGDLMAFWAAAALLNGSALALLGAVPSLIAGGESLGTLVRLAHADAPRPYHGTRRPDAALPLALEGVTFSYGRRPVLRGVDLRIEAGARIAVVGPNGAGKSTILRLLVGFHRPEGGRVTAAGVPFDDLDLVRLRRFLGVVPQDPGFFSGTVLENIAYGNPEVPRETVEEMAGLALADEFVRDLPDGYETEVGEGGVLLSRGQAQRIAVARALLRSPRALILDEPTNHLDRGAVARLMRNLEGLPQRPALLLISHDEEVVRHAGETWLLEDGLLRRREV